MLDPVQPLEYETGLFQCNTNGTRFTTKTPCNHRRNDGVFVLSLSLFEQVEVLAAIQLM